MSVTHNLRIQIIDDKGNEVLAYEVNRGVPELFSIIRKGAFLCEFKANYGILEVEVLKEIKGKTPVFDGISDVIIENQEYIDPSIILQLADCTEQLGLNCWKVYSRFRLKRFKIKSNKLEELKRILSKEEYEYMENLSGQRFDSRVEIHREKLNELFYIIGYLRLISRYAVAMKHNFKLSFRIN